VLNHFCYIEAVNLLDLLIAEYCELDKDA